MLEAHAIAPPGENRRQSALSAGFTLIEISIVLVIIGLIVGGVLVGHDLIRAAGVRATISQVEK
jgi:prepilin-type N-terminal cleavage/methylation domain-containing protein